MARIGTGAVSGTLTLNSAPDQQLVVYQAAPGSPSAERLALLQAPTP
ncbi:hypothetical protein [Kitasatospora sp. NPDC093679]